MLTKSILVLVFGLMLVFIQVQRLLRGGDGIFRGISVPAWTAWPLLIIGLGISYVGFREVRRYWGHKESMTDEEFAKNKAELDRMYIRDHGESPRPPEDGKTDGKP